MSEELEVLKEAARRLDGTGIAYMITGSTAANFYAVPRMTRDIDVVVELSERDIGKFILAFEKDHYLEPETVREAVKNKGMFNLIHDQHVIKVDFVVRKDTPYRRREFSRKKKDLRRRSGSLRGRAGRVDSVEAGVGEGLPSSPRTPCLGGEIFDPFFTTETQSSRRIIGRPLNERHIRRNGGQISRHAAQALRRGAPQDGLLHACNGTSSGSSVGAGSRAIGIACRVKKGSLSPFLRTGFR